MSGVLIQAKMNIRALDFREGWKQKMKKFNSYLWQARILPGIIVIIPFAFTINVIFFGNIFEFNLKWTVINGIILAFGIVVANIVRDFGKRKEENLWKIWGGAPTTRFLRHGNTEYNKYNRERCHRFLKMKFNGIKMPTAEDEFANPADADLKYQAYAEHLIDMTRNTATYPLIFAENKNYGFWRNLYGIKWFGVVTSLVLVVITLSCICHKNISILNFASLYHFIGYLNILFVLFWMFIVREKRIKLVADNYAKRLLEACFNYQEPVKENGSISFLK